MIYPIPSIQQTPNFVPIPMPVVQNSSLEVKLYHFRNRAIQFILDLFGLLVVYVSYGIIVSSMEPFARNYSCDMSFFNFPLLPEFVPLYAILLYGIIGPIFLIVLVEMFNAEIYPCTKKSEKIQKRFKKFTIITLHTIVLFAFGVGVIILLTAIIQRWTSKPRPNFLAVCRPLSNLNCITNQVGVGASGAVFNSISTGGTFCRGTPSAINEARMSFPSFPASFSTFTMVFLVIYLQARLVSLRFRSLRPLLQVTALIAALVTSVSDYIDYFADGWDISAGILLGSLIAVAFTMYISRVIWEYERKAEYSELNQQSDKQTPFGMQI